MKYLKSILLIALLSPLFLFSGTIVLEDNIAWNEIISSKIDELNTRKFLSFKNVQYDEKRTFWVFIQNKFS